MPSWDQSDQWTEKHSLEILAFIRFALGMMLFSKGLHFFSHPEAFLDAQIFQNQTYASLFLAHFIVIAHLAGGLMIAVGLLTRIAVAVQLPILVGALTFVQHSDGSLLTQGASWHFTIWILLMLCIFGAFGSGHYSADAYINKSHEKRKAAPPAPTATPQDPES